MSTDSKLLAGYRVHHLGIAVPKLEEAVAFYRDALGFAPLADLATDPLQKVHYCFLKPAAEGSPLIELLSPMGADSPINRYLSQGVGAYHICYEVEKLQDALDRLHSLGAMIISEPTPAVAFGNRNIAWCFTPSRQLIELLETTPSAS
jgi:methylmalonyl-CoA/ethylmalonyl-CoA epimerase